MKFTYEYFRNHSSIRCKEVPLYSYDTWGLRPAPAHNFVLEDESINTRFIFRELMTDETVWLEDIKEPDGHSHSSSKKKLDLMNKLIFKP